VPGVADDARDRERPIGVRTTSCVVQGAHSCARPMSCAAEMLTTCVATGTSARSVCSNRCPWRRRDASSMQAT
jgi:hypothetical protein